MTHIFLRKRFQRPILPYIYLFQKFFTLVLGNERVFIAEHGENLLPFEWILWASESIDGISDGNISTKWFGECGWVEGQTRCEGARFHEFEIVGAT